MAAAACCKWVIDTLQVLGNQQASVISTNALWTWVKFRYLYAYFFCDRHCAVADSCESQLGLRRELQEWSILFPSVICFPELMSTTTTDKFLFCSFISIGNCHYQEFSFYFFFWELYEHTRIPAGCSAGNLSQSYSLLVVDLVSVHCRVEIPQ